MRSASKGPWIVPSIGPHWVGVESLDKAGSARSALWGGAPRHRHLVRQLVGVHDGAVVTPDRGTVNEKVVAAVTAYVTKRNWLEPLAVARAS
jgi:hypothetical protein